MSRAEPEDLYSLSDNIINSNSEELFDLSLKIWNKPELGYKEHFAHRELAEFLESKGFEVTRSYGKLETAFRAEFGSTSGPTVAVLCEYDALPEIGHGCGHNLIAEAGIAAGMGIKEAVKATGSGRIVVIGTPAEEGGGGKIDLIRAGCFKDIDFCLMVHPGPTNIAFYKSQTLAEVVATYHGKASHAASSPWRGLNALDAAVTAYNGISVLRQQMKPTWSIHGIFTEAGTKPNCIPHRAQIDYYVRVATNTDADIFKAKVDSVLEAAALSSGCTTDITWSPNAFAAMETNPTLATTYQRHAEALGEQFPSRQEQEANLDGSTDMGNVSLEVPGIQPLFSIDPEVAFHSNEFRVVAGTRAAHEKTLIAARTMARTAVQLLSDPVLLKESKEEFKMMKKSYN